MMKRYGEIAEKIEGILLPICQRRQEMPGIDVRQFRKECLTHEQNNRLLEAISLMVDYLRGAPEWRNRFGTEEFMRAFDECLNVYQPQGASFFNFFMNRYALKMRGIRRVEDIDERKMLYNEGVYSFDAARENEDGDQSRSLIDQVSDTRFAAEDAVGDTIGNLYRVVKAELETSHPQDVEYLRGYLTILALSKCDSLDPSIEPYVDAEFFETQKDREAEYFHRYQREKAASGKSLQENAFLNKCYMEALAGHLGCKADTLRKKHKKIWNLLIHKFSSLRI